MTSDRFCVVRQTRRGARGVSSSAFSSGVRGSPWSAVRPGPRTVRRQWDEWYAILQTYMDRHGCAPGSTYCDQYGARLGSWATNQRKAYLSGTERVARLERLPGWEWAGEARQKTWDAQFGELIQ